MESRNKDKKIERRKKKMEKREKDQKDSYSRNGRMRDARKKISNRGGQNIVERENKEKGKNDGKGRKDRKDKE
jgi:hypothetical protein